MSRFIPHPGETAIHVWLDSHFGTGPLPDLRFWIRTDSQTIWAAAPSLLPPPGLEIQGLGVKAFRRAPPRGKPTSAFIALFGQRATRNVCDLDADQVQRFVQREPLTGFDGYGYQVVRTAWGVLGCGEIRDGVLRSLLPKHWLYGQPPLPDFGAG